MNTKRDLYHGADGDTILRIVREGKFRPDANHEAYFAEHRFESALMHGGDSKRKNTYAIKVRIEIPAGAAIRRIPTRGVQDTLIITSALPMSAEVLELYIREPHGDRARVVIGKIQIEAALRV